MKSKDRKKVNILEVNGAQFKDSISIANKIGDITRRTISSTKLRLHFLEFKQKEEHKTIHVNHTNKENCYKPFSKQELTRATQATKNSAPGPDKIHHEMLKHLPPEGLDSLLLLITKYGSKDTSLKNGYSLQ